MKELYKFINEHRIKMATNPLFIDGTAYSNPTEETLKSLGYKKLVAKEMPIKDGYIANPIYKDGEVITQDWELIKVEEGVI